MEVREMQEMMRELYLHNDKRRGAADTALWLVEEIGELAEAVRRKDDAGIREELADVLAWTFSLANLYGIELEEAFLEKYRHVCPSCSRMPCVCRD
ncbi:MAG TPA: nucleotide pyrophosphohydrolase [Candidatus Methanoperedenaceae archaeon]|nr:nucleotide pyrophosphohydrolase [Candidatus Methanoperedenaceae archaeon]